MLNDEICKLRERLMIVLLMMRIIILHIKLAWN